MQVEKDIDLVASFLSLLRFFGNYTKVYLVALVIALIVALVVNFTTTPSYEAKFTLSTKYIDPNRISDELTFLNELMKEESFEELALRLKLDQELVKDINNIKPNPLIEGDEYKKLDYLPFQQLERKVSIVFVKVSLKNPKHAPVIQEALVNYLGNNPYLMVNYEARINALTQVRNELSEQFATFDSLRTTLDSMSISGKKEQNLGAFLSLTNFFEKKIDGYRFMLELEEELANSKPIHVQEEVKVLNKPSWPKLSILLPAFLSSALFLGLLLSLVLEIRKAMRKERLAGKTGTGN